MPNEIATDNMPSLYAIHGTAADDEMKQQRKARAQEIKKDRGPRVRQRLRVWG